MAEFKHLSTIIIILQTFFLAHGHWPDSYESHQYDSHRNVFFNNDMEGPQNYHYLQMNGNQLVNHHSACNCVKLKYCSPTMEMARKMYTGFISDYINSQLQVIACDFIDNEMAVCCPNNKLNVNGNSVRFSKHRRTSNRQRHHRHRHESDEHKKWVWDIEEANSSEEKFSSTTQSYKTTIEYSNYPTQDTTSPPKSKTYNSTFFITHEDPKSKKNCPPPLSEEFELPKNHSFFKEPQPSTTQKSSTNIQSTTTSDNNLVPTENNSNTPIQTELQEKMKLINKKSCGLSFGSRIIGGEDAGFGRFSWMARLAYRNTTSGRITYRCAGSVIADKYVLTAGHCVSNLVDNLEITLIRLGDVNAELENECDENGICAQEEDFEIERIIVHPEYNNPRYANDIALIRLKQSTASSNRIGTICLPIGEYQDAATRSYDAGNGIVAGWGAGSRMNNAQNEMLQWIRLPFVNTTDCAEFYSNYTSGYRLRIMISNSQLCYQGRENGDACAGDSGGPLMNEAELNNDKFVILGLVSFGPRLCGLSNFPGVYTRVSSYVEWILRNIEPENFANEHSGESSTRAIAVVKNEQTRRNEEVKVKIVPPSANRVHGKIIALRADQPTLDRSGNMTMNNSDYDQIDPIITSTPGSRSIDKSSMLASMVHRAADDIVHDIMEISPPSGINSSLEFSDNATNFQAHEGDLLDISPPAGINSSLEFPEIDCQNSELPPVESCNTLDSSDEPAAAAKLSAILEDSFEEYWDHHRQIMSRKPTYDNFLEMFGLYDVYNSKRNPPCQASDGARTISKRYNEQRDRGYQAIFDSLPPNYLEEIFNSNQDESSSDKSCFLEKVSRVQETLFPRTTSQAQTPIQGRVQRRVYNKPLPPPKFEEPFDTAVFEALVGKNYQPGYPSYYYEQSTSAATKLRDEIQAELANQGRPKQRVFQKIIPRPEHGKHYGTVVFEAEGTKIQSPQSNYSEQAPTFDNSMDEFLHYERLAQGSDNNAELANQRRVNNAGWRCVTPTFDNSMDAELANQGRPKQRVFQRIIPRPEHGQHYGTVVFEAEGTKIQGSDNNAELANQRRVNNAASRSATPTFDNSMDEFLHYERLAQGSDNNATPPGLNLARTGEYLNNLRLEDLKRRKLTKRYEDALSNPNNFIVTSPSSPGTAAASNAAQSPRDLCLNAGTKRDQLIDNLRSPPPFLSRNRKAREQLSPFYQSPPVKLSRREKYKKALLNDFNQRAQNNVKFVDNLTSPPPFLSRNRRAREQLSPYYQSPPAQTRPEFMQFSPGGPFMNFSPTIQQTPSRHTPSGPRVNYSPRAVPSTKKIRKTLRFEDETRNNAHQNLTPPSISITPPNRPPCSPKYRTPTRRTVDEDLIEFNPLHPCMPAPKPPSLPSPLRPVPVNMVIQRHQDDNSAQNQVREPIRQVPVNVQRDQGQNRAQNQERKVIREITINVQRDQDQNIVQNQVRETFRQVPVNVDVQRDQGHNRAQNQMPEPIRPFNDNEREFLIRRLVMNGVSQLRAAQMVLGGKR